MGILTSLLILSFIVFFHELGHFLMARFFGVKVLTFSIGFGKAIFSKTINDTKYVLAMIPLGGFIQMKGQNDLDPNEQDNSNDSYNSKSPIERMIILFAGPFANFLLAFLIYIFLGYGEVKYLSPSIGEVQKDSPAYNVDIKSGDKIININGVNVKTWNEMSKHIKQSDFLTLVIHRDNEIISKTLQAKILSTRTIFGEIEQRKMIGISPSGGIVLINHSILDSLSYAYDRLDRDIKMIYTGIQKMIEGVISTDNIAGILSITSITADATSIGLGATLALVALISVNLGVLNLLPIPALDGGHIMFNMYELITRRKASEKVIIILTLAGWMILISLMLLGLYNDINRLW